MSCCSTTATATYTLQKYSRSYPGTSNTSNEWQHFMNPIIKLVLDIQKSPENKSESVRLRIIWTLETGLNTPNEVVFEDLDLLSFSNIPSRRIDKQPESLPLKAVYRDTIVGVRYIHPQDGSANAAYRRFQVTFASSSAVTQFIQSIETVCPCKANNNPAPPQPQPQRMLLNTMTPSRRTTTMMPPPMTPSQRMYASSDVPMSSSPFATHPHQPSHGQHNTFVAPTSEAAQYNTFPVPAFPDTAQPQPQSQCPLSQVQGSFVVPSLPENVSRERTPSQTTACAPVLPIPSSSLPSSSLPESSSNSTSQCSTDPILASLRDATKLYDLPPSKLEAVVAQVIREEGFVQLMENLSKMWRIKGYLGQSAL
ncbi:hypothetical protein VNI00_006374 [Paramarasmius palmivorus]|uniref:Uncharacterized protein n=1 Tax=Paramarasmius palmivorus TaxID=297713 RepID=A0AAW0D9Q0_9AGAR